MLAAAEEPERPAADSAAVPRELALTTKRMAPVAAVFVLLVSIKDAQSIDIASDRVAEAAPVVIRTDSELPLPELLLASKEVSEIHADCWVLVFPIVPEALAPIRPDPLSTTRTKLPKGTKFECATGLS